MYKKKMILAALGAVFLHCASPTDKDTLTWKMAIDIPMNTVIKIDEETAGTAAALAGIPIASLLPADTVIVDLLTGDFSIADSIFYVRKFRNLTADSNRVLIDNFYPFGFTIFAVIAPSNVNLTSDGRNSIQLMDLYKLIVSDSVFKHDPSVINFLGAKGLAVPARGTHNAGQAQSSISNWSRERLLDLITANASSDIGWRWLLTMTKKDFEEMSRVAADNTLRDNMYIDMRFRFRVRGESNLDSLLSSWDF